MTLGRLFVMTLVSFPLLFEFGAGVAMMGVLCVRVSVLLFTDTMKFQQPTTMSITIVFLTSYGFTGFTLLTKLGGQEKKKKKRNRNDQLLARGINFFIAFGVWVYYDDR